MKFEELQLKEDLLRAIADAGYSEPTPIQEQAIPPVLEGRDVLGCAQTGTGKTAAFALPILQRLETPREKQSPKRPIRALILTPTRELALQIQENFEMYEKYTALRSTVIFGGVSQVPQVEQLKKGVDVLIATPGRLLDLIGQKQVLLAGVEYFVLDEADRMLDMGFFPDVRRIIHLLPSKRQTLLFSATMPGEIQSLADSLLTDPIYVEVTPASSTVEMIHQCVYMVDRCNKRALLAHVIEEKGRQQTLVFTRTKYGADRVARDLSRAGISAAAIHGDKSQGARQRALSDFKNGKICVLVATDIAARGIDITGLPYVINFDLPEIPETYVHRIGRTGRAGMEGTAISFCDGAQMSYLIDIEELTGKRIEEIENHAYPMTGEQPAEQEPKPQQHRGGERRPRRDAPRGPEKKQPRAKAKPEKAAAQEAQGGIKTVPVQEPQKRGGQAQGAVAETADQPQKKRRRRRRPKSAAQSQTELHTEHHVAAAEKPREKPAASKVASGRQPEKHREDAARQGQKGKPSRSRGAGRNAGRGGRRVIDDDAAQVETRPLPARELPESLRARIAAKVASILNKHGGK